MRTDVPDIVENEHVDPTLLSRDQASLAKQAAVSNASKQHYVRPLHAEEQQKIADEALEHQAEIEAETRVEEGTAAELKSQVETVINKDEMIDVIGCTRGHGYKGVVTRWSCTRLPW